MLLDLEKLSDVMVNAVQQPIDAISKRVGDRIDELETLIKAQGIYIKQLEGVAETFNSRFKELEARQVAKGERGEDGKDGKDGDQGPQGEKGETGQQGPPGERGEDGKDGKDGKDGNQGPQGEKGEAGQQGPPGDPGPKGDPGDKGEQGEPGKDGMDGVNGKDGKDGQAGPAGTDGKDADPHEIAAILQPAIEAALPGIAAKLLPALVAKAVADIPVIHGRDGRDAPPGGPPGPPGPKGDPGRDGASVEYSGTWDRERSYTKGALVTWDGSMWHCKQETAGEVPGRTDAWQLAVKKGTPGREGPAGKDGAPGKDGRPGRDLVHPGSIA